VKIREIDVADVLAGKTWRFVEGRSETYEGPMEDWDGVKAGATLRPRDLIIYSGVLVTSKRVYPLLLLKELGDPEYGGDYCMFVDGRWRQAGLDPGLGMEIADAEEYIAAPSPLDPSFDAPDHDYREWHRKGFKAHVTGVEM
jgi:hypothetical protein